MVSGAMTHIIHLFSNSWRSIFCWSALNKLRVWMQTFFKSSDATDYNALIFRSIPQRLTDIYKILSSVTHSEHAEQRLCQVRTEWRDVSDGGMSRLNDVVHIQLCRLDLDTRVLPTRLDSSTPREAESGAPIIQPITRTPKTLSRFSANEKPALFSSAPSAYLTRTISHLAPLPFNASQLSNASSAIRPWLVVPNVGRRDPLRVPTGLPWGPRWNCSVAARIFSSIFTVTRKVTLLSWCCYTLIWTFKPRLH